MIQTFIDETEQIISSGEKERCELEKKISKRSKVVEVKGKELKIKSKI